MTDMLKGAQGVNTADLLKRKRELEREAIGRDRAATPKELRTLSPDQQRTIRTGKSNALSADIDANAYEIEKAEQGLDNFFRIFGEARKLGEEWADKMVAPDSVIQNARKIIESNPDAMSTVLAGFNDKSKQKILEGLDYTSLKKPGEAGKIVTIDGKNYVQNADGTFSQPQLPDATPTTEKVQKATDVISSIDAILNNPKLDAAIGPISSKWPEILRSGARNDVDAAIKALIAGVAIENLSLLKGPMSDKDVAFIKEASSGLNTNMSEEGFRSRLNLLRSKFEEIRSRAQSGAGGGGEFKDVGGVRYQKVEGGWQKVSSASGANRPQRNNNPGNLKSGGVADQLAIGTDEQGHLVFASAADGARALRMDIEAKVSGNSRHVGPNPTIAQLGAVYAEDGNWANKVAGYLGVSPATRTSAINRDALVNAIMKQEGAFA
jgi:hypothetical protein